MAHEEMENLFSLPGKTAKVEKRLIHAKVFRLHKTFSSKPSKPCNLNLSVISIKSTADYTQIYHLQFTCTCTTSLLKYSLSTDVTDVNLFQIIFNSIRYKDISLK